MLFRICVACDHTNPPDSRFCGKCGAPLQVRFCRLCRTANDAMSRFCRSCGTALPELRTPETEPPTAPGPATIPPLVAATPGRPVADAIFVPAAATLTSAFSGDEPRDKTNAEAGVPPIEGLAAQPVGRNGAQPAIEVLPPRPAHSTPILVDSAVTTVTLPAMIDDAPRSARTWRAPALARVVGVAVIGVALGALAYKAWRPGAADPAPDRAAAPAVPPPAAPVPPADTAAAAPVDAAPVDAAPPAPAAQPVAPPAAGANKTAPRERREAAPRTSDRAAAVPAAPSSPALRECTPAVAALGLCTPESKPEGN